MCIDKKFKRKTRSVKFLSVIELSEFFLIPSLDSISCALQSWSEKSILQRKCLRNEFYCTNLNSKKENSRAPSITISNSNNNTNLLKVFKSIVLTQLLEFPEYDSFSVRIITQFPHWNHFTIEIKQLSCVGIIFLLVAISAEHSYHFWFMIKLIKSFAKRFTIWNYQCNGIRLQRWPIHEHLIN